MWSPVSCTESISREERTNFPIAEVSGDASYAKVWYVTEFIVTCEKVSLWKKQKTNKNSSQDFFVREGGLKVTLQDVQIVHGNKVPQFSHLTQIIL